MNSQVQVPAKTPRREGRPTSDINRPALCTALSIRRAWTTFLCTFASLRESIAHSVRIASFHHWRIGNGSGPRCGRNDSLRADAALSMSRLQGETRLYRSAIGMYRTSRAPMYSARGRINLLSAYCSRMWPVQPLMRLMAKIGV
jgi:hypothetical protein